MSEIDEKCNLSSPGYPASENITRKPIKPPTVTPRRFKKFFTPIQTSTIQQNVRTSRRALQDITNPSGKQKHSSSFSQFVGHEEDQENIGAFHEGRGSKRKLSFATAESPLLFSPLRPEPFFLASSQDDHVDSVCSRRCSAEPPGRQPQESDQEDVAEDENETLVVRQRRDAVRPFNTLSRSCNILSKRLLGRRSQREPQTSTTWQYETASFYSNSKDTYFCASQSYARPALPFCSASCNSEYLRKCFHDVDGAD